MFSRWDDDDAKPPRELPAMLRKTTKPA